MEYIDGEDLASLLRRIGRPPGGQGGRDRAAALRGPRGGARRGVLHRDLKPANVMIDGRGQARITDFGLAGRPKTCAAAQPGQREVPDAGRLPTWRRSSFDGAPAASVQSDLYALGLVLYEIFTGRRVFAAGHSRVAGAPRRPDPIAPSELASSIQPAWSASILAALRRTRGGGRRQLRAGGGAARR